MNQQDKKRFANVLAGTFAMYRKEVTEFTAETFYQCLIEFSIEDVEAGFQMHIKKSKFAPSVAEIIENIQPPTLEVSDKAELAWGCIAQQNASLPHGRMIEVADPVAMVALSAIGGRGKIGLASYDDLVWIKKEFMATYETCNKKDLIDNHSGALGISHERRGLVSFSKAIGSDSNDSK